MQELPAWALECARRVPAPGRPSRARLPGRVEEPRAAPRPHRCGCVWPRPAPRQAASLRASARTRSRCVYVCDSVSGDLGHAVAPSPSSERNCCALPDSSAGRQAGRRAGRGGFGRAAVRLGPGCRGLGARSALASTGSKLRTQPNQKSVAGGWRRGLATPGTPDPGLASWWAQ